MSKIPSRDITGHCDEGECRDRVSEAAHERQENHIKGKHYSSPNPNRPEHTKDRDEQPAVWGGRV